MRRAVMAEPGRVEHREVPEDWIVLLPVGLTLEQGVLVEPVSVGCHCTTRAGARAALSSLIQEIEKGGTFISVGVFEEPPCVGMSVVCKHEIQVLGRRNDDSRRKLC